jgi:uncharacterized membrane protein
VWVVVVLLMLFVGYRSFTGEVFARGIHKSQALILTIGAVFAIFSVVSAGADVALYAVEGVFITTGKGNCHK